MLKSLRTKAASLANKAVAVAALALVAAPAFAQESGTTFDPSSYVSQITGTIAGILAIGGAVFAVHLAIKSTKWARRAS